MGTVIKLKVIQHYRALGMKEYKVREKWETLHLIRGGGEEFQDMKVPGQCPLVLLTKAGHTEGKAFESGDSRGDEWSKDKN